MEPFVRQSGLVAPLDRSDVDTDQIIPKQFLKRVQRTGFGQFLFYDWRFDPSGRPLADFVLNQPRYRGASIMLARANFGCGSSREHAPWALADYGFRVLIAPSFADIFYNNCFKNGLLAIALDEATVDQLFRRCADREGYRLAVDLELQTISDGSSDPIDFRIDPFRRQCLLKGLDDIALTLQREAAITAFEASREPVAGGNDRSAGGS
jgi:3-isopropylmalate/(R)-2-methylmalate dehydratase small subunit